MAKSYQEPIQDTCDLHQDGMFLFVKTKEELAKILFNFHQSFVDRIFQYLHENNKQVITADEVTEVSKAVLLGKLGEGALQASSQAMEKHKTYELMLSSPKPRTKSEMDFYRGVQETINDKCGPSVTMDKTAENFCTDFLMKQAKSLTESARTITKNGEINIDEIMDAVWNDLSKDMARKANANGLEILDLANQGLVELPNFGPKRERRSTVNTQNIKRVDSSTPETVPECKPLPMFADTIREFLDPMQSEANDESLNELCDMMFRAGTCLASTAFEKSSDGRIILGNVYDAARETMHGKLLEFALSEGTRSVMVSRCLKRTEENKFE